MLGISSTGGTKGVDHLNEEQLNAVTNVWDLLCKFFNNYGRWMFYSGSSAAFRFEERTAQFEILTKRTFERLNLSEISQNDLLLSLGGTLDSPVVWTLPGA